MVQDFQDQQEGRNGSSKDQVADSSVEPVDQNIEERRGARLCVGALTVVEMDDEDQTKDVEQIFRQEDVFDSPNSAPNSCPEIIAHRKGGGNKHPCDLEDYR